MKSKGFSLIELSIVLIIIGLIVAGVTGGKSLIDSAKYRALTNELESWKKATFAFRASTGRLPGDINNLGHTGYCRGSGCPDATSMDSYIRSSYPAGSFASPYDATSINSYAASFVDLYLEKIIDFKPTADSNAFPGENLPYSNIYKKTFYYFFSTFFNYRINTNNYFANNIKSGSIYIFFYTTDVNERRNLVKTFKYIDEKTDDGIYDTGSVLGQCYIASPSEKTRGTATYEESLIDTNDGYCDSIYYKVN